MSVGLYSQYQDLPQDLPIIPHCQPFKIDQKIMSQANGNLYNKDNTSFVVEKERTPLNQRAVHKSLDDFVPTEIETIETTEIAEIENEPVEEVTKDRIQQQLAKLDEMLEDPKCDYSLVLQQAYMILNLLHRKASQNEKIYSLDKQTQLWDLVNDLKASYNSWKVLLIACASGGLTAAGGALGIVGVLPGTEAGKSLAEALPTLLQSFSQAEIAKVISGIGQGVSGVGQGSGVFHQVFKDNDQAKQIVYQHLIEQGKKNQDAGSSASHQYKDNGNNAKAKGDEIINAIHRAIEFVLRGSTST